MPDISRFLGIVRALRHVLEWAALHKAELLANWEQAREGKPLNPIAPLE